MRAPRDRELETAAHLETFALFHDFERARVGLGVDGASPTGAVALYESVGMRELRRNDTWERPL